MGTALCDRDHSDATLLIAMAKIKGVALIGIVEALRGLRQSAEPRLDPSVRHYLDTRLLVNNWYPEADYRALLLALGDHIADRVPGDVWEFLGEEGAKAQFKDVYAMAVRPGDPGATLKRAATTWSLYHDTGRVEVDLSGGGEHATLKLHDYPLACTKLCSTTTGYVRQLVVQAGGRNVQVRMTACPPHGTAPVVWESHWQLPSD